MPLPPVPRLHAFAAALVAAMAIAAVVTVTLTGHGTPAVITEINGSAAVVILQVLGLGSAAVNSAKLTDVEHRLNGGLGDAIRQALEIPTDLVGHVHAVPGENASTSPPVATPAPAEGNSGHV
jgi:hypothetical protein